MRQLLFSGGIGEAELMVALDDELCITAAAAVVDDAAAAATASGAAPPRPAIRIIFACGVHRSCLLCV